jgi:ligand-binding sensor domain-containing protein
MPFNIFALLACFFLTSIAPVSGQNIYSLGIENGLSNNSVTSIHQDQYGFMWFGTFDGLNRFDGYTFTKFRKRLGDSTSLPDNMVTAIETSKGKMYIGTDLGVGVLDNQTLKFSTITYKPTDSPGKSKPLNWTISYLKVHNGTVYIGTNLGLFEWKTTEKDAKEVPLYKGGNKVSKYRVNSIAIAPNGDVWVAGREGLCVYKLKSRKFYVVNS